MLQMSAGDLPEIFNLTFNKQLPTTIKSLFGLLMISGVIAYPLAHNKAPELAIRFD